MGRRCSCRDMLAAFATDPRILTLPPAAQAIWLRLAMASDVMGGILPFSGFARVSLLVSASVTEVETHLPQLIAEGLVLEEGGTLALPIIVAGAETRASRTRAAQENGRNGGRPRRGETAEQARLRRSQTSMALLIPGGRDTLPNPATETQETQMESLRASDDSASSEQSDHLTGKALGAFVERCAEAAGFSPGMLYTWADPKAWRALGHSEEAILAKIRDVRARAKSPPGSWRYFADAIRAMPVAKVVSVEELRAEQRWEKDVRIWQERSCQGPMPVLEQSGRAA